MKYILVLFLCSFLYGQDNVYTADVTKSVYIQVALDSADTASIYLLYKNSGGSGGDFYLSETPPDGSEGQATNLSYIGKGGLAISIVPTFVTAEESDSLSATVQSYNWDKSESAYYASSNDLFYLVFDTYGTYGQAAVDYLNWTTNTMYTSDIGGIIMPGTGLKITFMQKAIDVSDADATISVGFHLLQ